MTRTDGSVQKPYSRMGLDRQSRWTDDGTGSLPTQYTYEPFGYPTNLGQASTNSYKYTGREDDGSRLLYYHARYYHPRLQRYLSEDPLGVAAGDPNLHAYVFNNPTNETDPIGEIAPLIAACLRGAAQSALPDVLQSLAKRKPPKINWGRAVANCLTGGLNKVPSALRVAGNASKSALPKPPTGKGSGPPDQRDHQRLFTKAQVQNALDKRDGTCANFGNNLDAATAQGHHIERRADGGTTTLDNLARYFHHATRTCIVLLIHNDTSR